MFNWLSNIPCRKYSSYIVIAYHWFDTLRYTSAADQTEEELMFWEGIADGPAKLTNLEDGKEWLIKFLLNLLNQYYLETFMSLSILNINFNII